MAGAPWGILHDFKPESSPLKKIISQETIYYYLMGEDVFSSQEHIAYPSIVSQAINSWFSYSAQQIKNAGREQEFADILPLLNKPVKIAKTSEQGKSDVQLLFTSPDSIAEECGSGSLGCIVFNAWILAPELEQNEETNENNYNTILDILTHEIGHWYGMADQYYQGAEHNASVLHSTSDRIDKEMGIMDTGKDLACDDVDGFINLIDYTLAQTNGSYSRRAKRGWRSFCDNTLYKNAKVVNRDPYMIGNRRYDYTAQGDLKSTQYKHPFLHENIEINSQIKKGYWQLKTPEDEEWDIYQEKNGLKFISGPYKIFANRQEKEDGKVIWDFPYQDRMASVELSENLCKVGLSLAPNFSVEVLFNNQRNPLRTTTYFATINPLEPSDEALVLTSKVGTLQAQRTSDKPFSDQGICSLQYQWKPILMIKGGQLTILDSPHMSFLIQKSRMSGNDVIKDSKALCNQMQTIENENKELIFQTSRSCHFFSEMEKLL